MQNRKQNGETGDTFSRLQKEGCSFSEIDIPKEVYSFPKIDIPVVFVGFLVPLIDLLSRDCLFSRLHRWILDELICECNTLQ